MAPVTDWPREILIRSQHHEAGEVHLAVRDSGIGIDSETAEQLFSAFFTNQTQRHGNGIVDQPFDHQGPRWQIVGIAKRGPRRSFSIYRAH